MKNKNKRLSANEINRFVYCPYQWYYGRFYGQTVLKEKYKALSSKDSKHESNFKKGLNFHKNYYRRYRLKRFLQIILLLIILLVVVFIGSQYQWGQLFKQFY